MTRNSDKSAVELDLVIDLPCKPNIYVSLSTSKIREGLVPSTMVKHCSNFLIGRSKALLLLWNPFCHLYFVSVFVILSFLLLAALWSPDGKNGCPLGSLICDVFFCFCHFSICVLSQVWYFIVSIPDIFLLPYFYNCDIPSDLAQSCDLTQFLT